MSTTQAMHPWQYHQHWRCWDHFWFIIGRYQWHKKKIIASLVDTSEVRQIPNWLDTEFIHYLTYLIPNLFNNKLIRYQTDQIPNIPINELTRYWTLTILNLSDIELVRYSTNRIRTSYYLHGGGGGYSPTLEGISTPRRGLGDWEGELFLPQFWHRARWECLAGPVSWGGREGTGEDLFHPNFSTGSREGWQSLLAGRGRGKWGGAMEEVGGHPEPEGGEGTRVCTGKWSPWAGKGEGTCTDMFHPLFLPQGILGVVGGHQRIWSGGKTLLGIWQVHWQKVGFR
jgi:hypothetical protein